MKGLNLERKPGQFVIKPGVKKLADTSEDGQPHYWVIEPYVRYVSKGVCECGAVKFFANVNSRIALQQAAELNRKHSKKGAGHEIKLPAGTVKKEARTMIEETGKREHIPDLPPVPPKPKGSKYEIGKYYDDNKDLILLYREKLGEKEMLKRWDITRATWLTKRKDGRIGGLAVRFGLVPTDKGIDGPAVGTKDIDRPTEAEKPGGSPQAITLHMYHKASLPRFPEFNDHWSAFVQEKWLESYVELARGKS